MFKREIILLAKIIRNNSMSDSARKSLVVSICEEMKATDPLFNYKLFKTLALPDIKEK